MRALHYKVTATGRLSVWNGKLKLSEPWLYVTPPLAVRRTFRARIDPALVRAAWLLYRTRALPGHIEELRPNLALIQQVLNDNPRLWVLVHRAVTDGYLKPTSPTTAIARLKDLLCATGLDPKTLFERNPYGCVVPTQRAEARAKRQALVRFWVECGRYGGREPLTPAGWRFLQRQDAAFHQSITRLSDLCGFMPTLNALAQAGIERLPMGVIELVHGVRRTEGQPHAAASALMLARAYAAEKAGSIEPRLLVRQIGVLRDWWDEDAPVIHSGTQWATLVARATAAEFDRHELQKKELAGLRWDAPMPAFVTTQALVVTPLVSGAELLDEGQQVLNCLRNTRSYATRAMQGTSQVFRVQGGQGRATVELIRDDARTPWRISQAVGPENSVIENTAILAAVDELVHLANQPYLRGAAA